MTMCSLIEYQITLSNLNAPCALSALSMQRALYRKCCNTRLLPKSLNPSRRCAFVLPERALFP